MWPKKVLMSFLSGRNLKPRQDKWSIITAICGCLWHGACNSTAQTDFSLVDHGGLAHYYHPYGALSWSRRSFKAPCSFWYYISAAPQHRPRRTARRGQSACTSTQRRPRWTSTQLTRSSWAQTHNQRRRHCQTVDIHALRWLTKTAIQPTAPHKTGRHSMSFPLVRYFWALSSFHSCRTSFSGWVLQKFLPSQKVQVAVEMSHLSRLSVKDVAIRTQCLSGGTNQLSK